VDVNSLRQKVDFIQQQLMQSGTEPNSHEFIDLTKELAHTSQILDTTEKLEKAKKQLDEATELLDNPEFTDIAIEEIERLKSEISELEISLKSLTRKPLPNDDKKAILEIRPGVGGVEAALFAEDLFRIYLRYCNSINLRIVQYTLSYEAEGGIKECVFLIDKTGSFGDLRFESGVHRVQRVPVTESAGRIHTSTASVVVLPEQPDINVEIKSEDLRIDVYRSSGPGGQSVNTTDSAVRITHIPTNIVVTCQEGKSQHKNKDIALSILKSKLYQIELSKKESEEKEIRELSIQGGERSSKIRTYNFPQGRVTDHRIPKSWFNISEIMSGNINEIVKEVSNTLRDRIQQNI
jgi:peptide chain release factor 1